jgi:hypothetical protein
MKITMKETALHPVELFPDDPDDTQSYALRYEEGKSYDVDQAQGQLFTGMNWAERAEKGVDLSEPFDTREADDDLADQIEREVHEPARERAQVETVRYIGTGTNERVGDHGGPAVDEGDNVRVIDLGQDGNQTIPADGDTLDVQDATSEGSAEV